MNIAETGRYPVEAIELFYNAMKSKIMKKVGKGYFYEREFIEWDRYFEHGRQHGFEYNQTLKWILQATIWADASGTDNHIEHFPYESFLRKANELMQSHKVVALPVLNYSTKSKELTFNESELALMFNMGILPIEVVIAPKEADNAVLSTSDFVRHDLNHYVDMFQVFKTMDFLRSDRGVLELLTELKNFPQEFRVKILMFLFWSQHEVGIGFNRVAIEGFTSISYELRLMEQNTGVTLSKNEQQILRIFLQKYYKGKP